IAGTTRDLVEVSLDLQGLKVIVTDTAGLRETDDIVERIGVQRTIRAAGDADLIVELVEVGAEVTGPSFPDQVARLKVAAKADVRRGAHMGYDHAILSLTGAGLAGLLDDIAQRAKDATIVGGGTVPSRARHVRLLTAARGHIEA